jgi:nicotinamidase-related amidase
VSEIAGCATAPKDITLNGFIMATRRRSSLSKKPTSRGVAIVLIDVINGFDFPGSHGIVAAAKRATPRIQRLLERGRELEVPIIYVNDNFGRWRSDFKAIVSACTAPEQPGALIAERLKPTKADYFVLKPQHSGFYSTSLELLLTHLHVRTLILVGFATNLCVQFTANDAHMRGYQLVVPSDCTASNTPSLTRAALAQLRVALHSDVRPSASIDFAKLGRNPKKPTGKAF